MKEHKNCFSHIDDDGNANMVDVGHKLPQLRIAKAFGKIILSKETIKLIKENAIKKGDVLTVAKIAGIQSAKLTPHLIPLCHPINITKADVLLDVKTDSVEVASLVKCIGSTGVEMEALTAVNVALLTIYDMCKAVDKHMIISDIHLMEKKKENIA